MSLITNAIKQGVEGFVKDTRKDLSKTVPARLNEAALWLPSSVTQATALFEQGYGGIAAALASWLGKPPTAVSATKTANKALDLIERQAKKL
jgi:hypothetical protein